MEQKFSPKSKVREGQLVDFSKTSRDVYYEYQSVSARLNSLKGQTVTVTENAKKVEADYHGLASKQAKEKPKTAVIVSSVVAAVIYIIVFIIALIKANYLSEKIFAIVLPGLLIGLALYVAINLIRGAFEEMLMDDLRATEEYSKAMDEAKEKDRQLTLQKQKEQDDEIASLKAKKDHLTSQYGELLECWDQAISKVEKELERYNFDLEIKGIFELLLKDLPQYAETYEEAIQNSRNRLVFRFAEANKAFETLNSLINQINNHVEQNKAALENEMIQRLSVQFGDRMSQEEIRSTAKKQVNSYECNLKLRESTEDAINDLRKSCKGYPFTVHSDGSVSRVMRKDFLNYLMELDNK